jgi:hypothetical protein
LYIDFSIVDETTCPGIDLPCGQYMKHVRNQTQVEMYGRTFWSLDAAFCREAYGPDWQVSKR